MPVKNMLVIQRFQSGRPDVRLMYWGAPMAGQFSKRLCKIAQAAAERYGEREPCPIDVLEQELGEHWMEKHPGLASLVTSYHLGVEVKP